MTASVPRYWPARALPAYAFLPGRSARPQAGAAPDSAQCELSEENWSTHELYLWGVDLYNAGYAWEAHEAWEHLWRAALLGSATRQFLQGLIQCAAASVKSALGDVAAVRRIGQRGLDRLTRVPIPRGAAYLGVELAWFSDAWADFLRTQPGAFAERPTLRLHMPSAR
jgi:hypothetical protein